MLRLRSILSLTLLALAFSLAGCVSGPKPPATPDETTSPAQESKPKLYSFYPLPPAPPRFQFLTQFSDIGEIVEREVIQESGFTKFLFGKTTVEEEPDVIPAKPYGIAAAKGKLYVADTKNSRLVVYDFANGRQYAMKTAGLGKLGKPVDIFIEPGGYIFVADIVRRVIVVYDQAEQYVTTYGKSGQFRPTSVWVHQDEIFVADIQDNEVEVLDRNTGELKRKFGGVGYQDGHFNAPTSLAVSEAGNVFVTDTFNFRVQIFDLQGTFLTKFGQVGDVLGTFSRPKGLTITPDGILCVLDAAFAAAQVFDETGRILTSFGGNGEMLLPVRITADSQNVHYFDKFIHPDFAVEQLLFITNSFGERKISVYGFGHLKDPSKPIGIEQLKPVEKQDEKPDVPEITPTTPEPEEVTP